ncbi:hypothetical protein C5167_005684 [Papaver somniferum]|uniref:Uncharacterized protein n=1 Tax=Papaver somniferum TaxID=3469 RepID=A0A4Y7JEE7_PAPSO|nr:hypothetical protein C5167_005684 [Papaver somniferum]
MKADENVKMIAAETPDEVIANTSVIWHLVMLSDVVYAYQSHGNTYTLHIAVLASITTSNDICKFSVVKQCGYELLLWGSSPHT